MDTIQREIKRRNAELLASGLEKIIVYCADTAQEKYERNKQNKGPNLKIGNDHRLVEHIEKKSHAGKREKERQHTMPIHIVHGKEEVIKIQIKPSGGLSRRERKSVSIARKR